MSVVLPQEDVFSWLNQHGPDALKQSTRSKPPAPVAEEDELKTTEDGYHIDTRSLDEWFCIEPSKNNRGSFTETVFRTAESQTFVSYRRRIVKGSVVING